MVCCSFFGLRPNLRIKQDQNRRQFYGHASSSSAIPGGASLVSETPHQTQVFTYRELATATNNFRRESLIGRGGFGAVYKGVLASTGQTVAVKVHDKTGLQGDKEFLVEVLMLSLVSHQHLVKLIGYCAEGDQRLVVYEYMPLGSVEDHLHRPKAGQQVLDWNTRMQIAAGAAKGLEHLHNVATPHVIYRDLKTANILLDHGYEPKLSDFGLAKFGPTGDRSHVSTKVMGTLGYCAPEYADTGKLTDKSDIFSFGVVLLELVTGRKAFIDSLAGPGRYLVTWARLLYTDENIKNILDPKLSIRNQYMEATVKHAVKLAFMCLREDATKRPSISEVVNALDYIAKCTSNIRKRSNSGSENVSSSKGKSSILDNKEKLEELNREKSVAEAKTWAKNVARQEKEPPSPSP